MSAHPTWKTVAAKTSHSVSHNLMTLALPFKSASENWPDVLGGVAVVGLSAGLLVLMRLLLAD
ncbi:MAG TPA: hypothetical protein VIK62_09345 [Verrucomicrobiae bacterium]